MINEEIDKKIDYRSNKIASEYNKLRTELADKYGPLLSNTPESEIQRYKHLAYIWTRNYVNEIVKLEKKRKVPRPIVIEMAKH